MESVEFEEMTSADINRLPVGALCFNPHTCCHLLVVANTEKEISFLQLGSTHVFLPPTLRLPVQEFSAPKLLSESNWAMVRVA
jgi:hypothetical protein